MRKILIVAALLAGGALLSGTPAKAEIGCTCLKLGAPLTCTSGPGDCTLKGGGLCVTPCDYQPPKTMFKRHSKKKKKM